MKQVAKPGGKAKAAKPSGRTAIKGCGAPHSIDHNADTMALVTSDCGAMRSAEPQMALITSDCAPSRKRHATIADPQQVSHGNPHA